MSNHLLPEEIVWEIVLRLPSRSLIRFKSVCKSWSSLISDSQFLFKHLRRIPADDLVLLLARRPRDNEDGVVYSLLSDQTLTHLSQPQPLPCPPELSGKYKILCCNGLMCIYDSANCSYLVIWCPATGHIKSVPESDVPNPNLLRTCKSFFELGFCYDSNTNDYKVIKISDFFYDDDEGHDFAQISKIEIYSLNANCWRATEHRAIYKSWDWRQGQLEVQGVNLPAPFHFVQNYDKPMAYVNGVFFWLANMRVWGTHVFLADRIIWFRMSDEEIGITNIPIEAITDSDDFSWDRRCFALNHGVLAFSLGRSDWIRFDIWVLLEFGVEDSWIKLFSFDTLPTVHSPVWFWNGGKIIMQKSDGDLVLCDPFTGELQSLDVGGVPYSWNIVSFKRGQQIMSMD